MNGIETDLDVRIERLEPMRVATAHAMSETPERDAWEKLRAWAEHKGLFDAGGEIEAIDFQGGLYAVATCRLHGDPKGNVIDVWKKLWEWVQSSAYKWRETHELEKLHNPLGAEKDAVLDLYLPIEGA